MLPLQSETQDRQVIIMRFEPRRYRVVIFEPIAHTAQQRLRVAPAVLRGGGTPDFGNAVARRMDGGDDVRHRIFDQNDLLIGQTEEVVCQAVDLREDRAVDTAERVVGRPHHLVDDRNHLVGGGSIPRLLRQVVRPGKGKKKQLVLLYLRALGPE